MNAGAGKYESRRRAAGSAKDATTRAVSAAPARRGASRSLGVLTSVLAGLLIVGCASPQLDAQWSDPQLAGNYLRGAKVLVACDAGEAVVQRICRDRLAAEVVARGATPVFAADGIALSADRAVDVQLVPAARDAGAKALMVVTVAVAVTDVSPGFSIGIGGFGFGRNSGGGVGVSAPIGGGRVTSGYSANSRVTDVASGRLVWAAKATTPPSADVDEQLANLSKAVFNAADKAGLF